MKPKKLLLLAFRLAVAIALASVAVLSAAAQDRDDHRDGGWARECSLKTLHGRYGIFVQGTLLPPTYPTLPFVVSGVFTYDGEGNVSGTYTQSIGGAILRGSAGGTYQVNPDCTYAAELNGSVLPNRRGTITGEGMQQEIHIVYTDPSLVAFGTLKKTPQGECSLETLNGTYALFGQGTILPPLTPSPFAHETAGILTFDGAGHYSGEDWGNTNGTSAQNTFYGTYDVTSDCKTSVEIYVANKVLTEEGSITGEGEFKEIHDIFTTAGWVFTDTLKKQR